MKVLFIHENTLGHGSYLPVFMDYFTRHPALGIQCELLNATPLPEALAKKAEHTVRGLRRFGLDGHFARWRNVVSAYVRDLVNQRGLGDVDAVVVNTQSVALNLADIPKPLFVCLDATFQQLSESKWFSDPPLGPVGTALNSEIIGLERVLFTAAKMILPWSQLAAASLAKDYQIDSNKIQILPPSIEMPPIDPRERKPAKALFIGSDFKRKGGELLLQAFEERLKKKIELQIVSNSPAATTPPVHRGSAEWEKLWRSADLFLFPSKLETFGIVLIEALAFGVPIIASRAGAAEEILENGKAGILLKELTATSLGDAVDLVLNNWNAAIERATYGRKRAEADYDLAKNAVQLAEALKGVAR